MNNRRGFLRDAALLVGASAVPTGLFESIASAASIAPAEKSTFLDAEHVVILMQENRSFDHVFGTLQGVRGFNDPRAVRLPNGDPVWVQTDEKGQRFAPFRLDMRESNATWMGSLPHDWPDQVDATSGGRHDRWLQAKRSGNPQYAHMPLTMGCYTRRDVPFYYALADAFTVCDQYFCSSLTATTPNRLHLWTGTVRPQQSGDAPAHIRNEDTDYYRWAKWKTFPERLEDHGVSWRIYQNEISMPNGLEGESDSWLSNFTDNPIEWFAQFNIRFVESRRRYAARRIGELPQRIEALEKKAAASEKSVREKIREEVAALKLELERLKTDVAEFTAEAFARLPARAKSLHERAFTTNVGDPHYRELHEIEYDDRGVKRKMKLPKGDVLHQFRKDVRDGKLPTVSWLVAPENFSDHPSSAWFGSWYLSEVLNILTSNPEVWRKTIFILNYDENDGYFDHVPPFQAPRPKHPETGAVSAGIDPALEYVELDRDRNLEPGGALRGNAIGLGYRVPAIIASPWTRGGCVCSQVFDHTSVLQFLEKLVSHRTGRRIEETNISAWRRAVCGDLTAAFQNAGDDAPGIAGFLRREEFATEIHKAKFKQPPAGFHILTDAEVDAIRRSTEKSPLPRQEPGVRRSSPLPYQLEVDGSLSADGTKFTITFEARKEQFRESSAGSPFIVYAANAKGTSIRHYAVAAGGKVADSWALADFAGGRYDLRVLGPNGFHREFRGGNGPKATVQLSYHRGVGGRFDGDVEIVISNHELTPIACTVEDTGYGDDPSTFVVPPGVAKRLRQLTSKNLGWYSFRVVVGGPAGFEKVYAGRVETGDWSITDPLIGGETSSGDPSVPDASA